ncbi:Nif11-like leader peptide family RiPP precursor [Aphanizomenon sp. UHCC 0183]|uniref:Nif11-like leader peptide family RiPP precursor n=1 Tax=Aphanizomenon sp. UHCC 0183 TaxID=2590028 RepID=UPI001447EF73|nr:Nif11-like leader peptide family RiPP precursor [Aphanizomenon sp. UHCC 0183]MTJ29614.1 Nif11-like leader peptide family natural product precursor [Aphanizomenon sp. UHCC 0183]
MSKNVEDFLNQVGEDATLQAELGQALESENDREAVTALANSKGYEFSSEELWAEIQKRQAELAQSQATGELSDAELEAVAGGIRKVLSIIMKPRICGNPPFQLSHKDIRV